MFTACGRSMVDKWPHSGTTTRFAPGIAAAISRAKSGGVASSLSPTRTSVGHLIAREARTRIHARHDRLLLAQIGFRAGLLVHGAHGCLERRVVVTAVVHQGGILRLQNFAEAAALGQRDERLALLGPLRRLAARAGVEQRELGDARCRLAHDLEGDIAAHRQPDQRKARRGCGQDPPRHRRHAVVAPMIGDGDGTELPQRRDLLGIKPRRAVQPGDKNGRQSLRRSFRHWRSPPRHREKVKQSV